jgi:hypothetical protein
MKKSIALTIAAGLIAGAAPAESITIGIAPLLHPVVQGEAVSIAVVISGLSDMSAPSLATYDLDIGFDPTALHFLSVTFTNYLGDPVLGEADTSFDDSVLGSVSLFELSYLEADSVSCLFCIPPYLDESQPDSFTLATLTFDTLSLGESYLTLALNSLGDANGDELTASLSDGSITVIPSATVVPIPASLWLLASGLGGLFGLGARRRRR